eukprot:10839288-Lingulodinium_polyedra.AAC.1
MCYSLRATPVSGPTRCSWPSLTASPRWKRVGVGLACGRGRRSRVSGARRRARRGGRSPRRFSTL